MGVRDWLIALWGRSRKDASDRTEAGPEGRVPFHVAIIMDGNGRWARRRHLPVIAGHRAGTQAVRRVIEAARDAGIGQLTLYSFSTENWNRPADEVEGLMRLHGEMIDSEVPTLHANDCRVVFLGRRDELSAALRAKMEWAETLTVDNRRMTLFIAFNYGGRREIADAVRRAAATGIEPKLMTEDDIAAHLYSPFMRDPDLLIRTSGERRLSNFLLWQSAYSELFFSERLWPDFDEEEFLRALRDYAGRERRFGAREDARA
ncbi:MAG: polyprenyl diphosphate synthase [bacterium]